MGSPSPERVQAFTHSLSPAHAPATSACGCLPTASGFLEYQHHMEQQQATSCREQTINHNTCRKGTTSSVESLAPGPSNPPSTSTALVLVSAPVVDIEMVVEAVEKMSTFGLREEALLVASSPDKDAEGDMNDGFYDDGAFAELVAEGNGDTPRFDF